jgi:hypothetical protein
MPQRIYQAQTKPGFVNLPDIDPESEAFDDNFVELPFFGGVQFDERDFSFFKVEQADGVGEGIYKKTEIRGKYRARFCKSGRAVMDTHDDGKRITRTTEYVPTANELEFTIETGFFALDMLAENYHGEKWQVCHDSGQIENLKDQTNRIFQQLHYQIFSKNGK